MEIHSEWLHDLPYGVQLQLSLDGEPVGAYVLYEQTDLEIITQIVPQESVAEGASIHALGVTSLDEIDEAIETMVDNVNPHDIVVFFCLTVELYQALLNTLGLGSEALN